MNSKNISILFVGVLVIIISTNLLMIFNSKNADFTPPPPDFESNQKTYNDLIKKADIAAANEDNENAFVLYKDALKYYPGNQGILSKMGILKLKSKKFKDAEKIYTDLSRKSPDQPAYKVSLAFALLYQEKFQQAGLVIEQAVRMRSNDARIHLISAAVKAQGRNVDETLNLLKRYPMQTAVLNYLSESFFDPVREDEKFKNYQNQLIEEKNKNSENDQ